MRFKFRNLNTGKECSCSARGDTNHLGHLLHQVQTYNMYMQHDCYEFIGCYINKRGERGEWVLTDVTAKWLRKVAKAGLKLVR